MANSSAAAPSVLYREGFASGPGAWCTGKDREDGSWHRNILRQRGHPEPAGWQADGGGSGGSGGSGGGGGFAFVESPWYFDDNHGELFWLYLVFFLNRSADAGLGGADLREVRIDLTLRGRDFQRRGTRLYFWIQGHGGDPGAALSNWCLTSQPIVAPLDQGQWAEASVRLTCDESQWSQMGHLNGGLARRIRVLQSTSMADGLLEGLLRGGHVNMGFILGGIDNHDPPQGRLEFKQVTFARG